MYRMVVTPITTRVLMPPRDDLLAVIQEAVPSIPEKSILAVTSKVVSIWQGRCVAIKDVPDKDALVRKEADWYIPRDALPEKKSLYTIRHNVLIASAGIDQSNGNGYYVLLPEDPRATAQKLLAWVQDTYHVRDMGILIVDSHSIPLRRGAVGISLGYAGFAPLHDYRGTHDLFGRTIRVSVANSADSIAAAANLVMGEGNESVPLALVADVPYVQFSDVEIVSMRPFSQLMIAPEEDKFSLFFKNIPWREGGHGKS